VEVLVTESAKQYLRRHGGAVYVRAHPHRCCTGTLTVLDLTTEPPPDASQFMFLAVEDVAVRYLGGPSGAPEQLTIKLAGVLSRHPVAFWDGCAYKP
jgi:hypothetical protein